MSRRRCIGFAGLLIGGMIITSAVLVIIRRASSSTPPVVVSLTKSQYGENEPIYINITITNPHRRRIRVRETHFRMTERRGGCGFYIYDDELRNRLLANCPGCFPPHDAIDVGGLSKGLEPQGMWIRQIKIPSEARLPRGTCALHYELRIPYSGADPLYNRTEFVVDLYGHPLKRHGLDYWKDVFIDYINGDGEFVLSGELTFVVKRLY